MMVSHNDLSPLEKKLTKTSTPLLKIRDKLDITDVTSLQLGRNGSMIEVMLRTSGMRQKQFMLTKKEERL